MDIISYSKAMKAKKSILALNKRLGEGDNKSGPKDIKDIHVSTKKRLEELEKKRLGLNVQQLIIDTDEEFNAGVKTGVSVAAGRIKGVGSWESVIDLGEHALEFGSIGLKTIKKNLGEIAKIPKMTGDSSPSPWRTTSNTGSYPYYLFNNSAYTDVSWRSTYDSKSNLWVQLDFGSDNQKIIQKYELETVIVNERTNSYDNMMPGHWRIEGSNDGVGWTTLDERIVEPGFWGGYRDNWDLITKEFTIASPQSFRFYRIYIIRINQPDSGSRCQIGGLNFYETTEASDSEFDNDFTGVSIQTDTGEGYKVLDASKNPTSVFRRNPKVKITLDGTRELDKLIVNYKARPLLNRVSELEKNTHINLNKHNLRVNTVLNHRRYKLKEMIIDDFKDSSGIDQAASKNISYDSVNHKIKQLDATALAEVVLIKEQLNAVPTMFTLSAVTSENNVTTIPVDLSKGEFVQTEVIDNVMSLKKKDGLFAKSGSWVSEPIDLGENVKKLSEISMLDIVPEGTIIKVLTATSTDGAGYEEFKELNLDNTLQSKSGRYVKVKIEMTAKATAKPAKVIHDFTSEEAANYEKNIHIELDGVAKLKTAYVQEMVVDASFQGEGTLLRTTIDKTKFKAIEKVEVK